jgi:uncharacterized protein YjbI with pentapeptide repeats
VPAGAPREPYPPDLPEDAPALEPADADLLDLTDVLVEGADWANLQGPRALWHRVELRTVRLTGAQLGESTLRDVVFADCRIDLAGLRMARLERVAFRDCRLEELDLYGATLEDVVFQRCVLREATIDAATLKRCAISGCDLAGLRGAERLAGVRMTWDDVLANAPTLAAALGIVVVD